MALGLAGWEWFRSNRRRAVVAVVGAATPLVIWSSWLTATMGEGLTPRGNFSLPVVGIIRSAMGWADTGTKDLVFSVIALTGLGLALLVLAMKRHQLVFWLTWPWVAVAVVSSTWVWDLGNNSLRVFAPLIVFGLLGIAAALRETGRA